MKNIVPIIILLLATSFMELHSQLFVDGSLADKPERLVKEVLVGSGLQVSNCTAVAKTDSGMISIGTFDGNLTNIGLSQGLIMTTGFIQNAIGPNDKCSEKGVNGLKGDPTGLETILPPGSSTKEATILEFDFIPTFTKLSFSYVFASEEYKEYVEDNYNDAFAFFVSGPGIAGMKNIALIPGTDEIVSINTIHNGHWECNATEPTEDIEPKNEEYFIDNDNGQTIQYDGFTVPLDAVIEDLIPGETYHIKLVIADVYDANYDSGVFLLGGSFSSEGTIEKASVCAGEPTSFSCTPPWPVESFSWDFGDGATSDEEAPQHTFDSGGQYNISLYLKRVGYDEYDTVKTIINIQEVKAIYGVNQIDTRHFKFSDSSTINTGEIVTREWDFGDGNTSTDANPDHFYTENGIYDVTLTVTTDSGCVSSVTKTVNSFDIYAACKDEEINFSVATNIVTEEYTWNFGDGNSSKISELEHAYSQGGEYDVMLIIKRSYSERYDTAITKAYIQEITANFDSEIDINYSYSFDDLSGINMGEITEWEWDFGDGTSSAEQNPLHEFPTDGKYTITLWVTSDSGCTDMVQKTIDVFPGFSDIFIPELSVKVNDMLDLPIIISDSKNLDTLNIHDFSADIHVDKNILLPQDSDIQYSISGEECIIPVSGSRKTGSDTIYHLPLRALLGDKDYCEVKLENFTWLNSSGINLTTQNGSCTILGLCQEGEGTRYVTNGGAIVLYSCVPNPVHNNNAEIKFRIVESPNTRLELYDILGNKVMSLVDGKIPAGEHSVNLDLRDLQQGVYYYILITSDTKLTRRMEVVK